MFKKYKLSMNKSQLLEKAEAQILPGTFEFSL